MKKKIFNTGVLGLTMIVLLLSVSACKSKQKVAQEEAAAAYNLKTGRPDKFAQRLGISKRQLYNILEMLKDFDAPIKYDRTRETFFYNGDFELDIQFSMRILTEKEDRDILGGCF